MTGRPRCARAARGAARTTPPRLSAALILAVTAAIVMAGCSGTRTFPVPGQDDQGRHVIILTGENRFEPAEAQVPVGATVVWRVEGGFHDVSEAEGEWTSSDNATPDEAGYPTPLGPGDEYVRTFNEKATYTVWCHIHHEAGMKLTLQVR